MRRRRGVDSFNRVVLTLLGLILLAAGVAGVLLATGVLGDDRKTAPVLGGEIPRFASRHDEWFWGVVAGVAVVVGLLCLRWLVAQLSTRRVGGLDLEPNRKEGRTRIASSALTDAVAEEIEGYRGVADASARLVGDQDEPGLALTVSLDDRADVGALRDRIESEAIAHARQALERPELRVLLDLRLQTTQAPRVA